METVREQYIVDPDGVKTAVILPVTRYRKIMEDLHDLAVIAERKQEGTFKSSDLVKRLKADGIL